MNKSSGSRTMKGNGKPPPKPRRSSSPRRRDTLQKQQKRLCQEIKELKAERDQYKKSLLAMMHKHVNKKVSINKKELLALVGQQPPWRDLLAELEAEGDRPAPLNPFKALLP